MIASDAPLSHTFEWLTVLGFTERQLSDLNPCVPGEFTLPQAIYVNTGSPGIFYRGTEEGTLPLVAGRWYLIPSEIVDQHADIRRDTQRVARARRLVG